jgi:hypothetical protein
MITGTSVALLEAYAWWALCGRPLLPEQSARTLDAFVWIERLQNEANVTRRREAERLQAFLNRR